MEAGQTLENNNSSISQSDTCSCSENLERLRQEAHYVINQWQDAYHVLEVEVQELRNEITSLKAEQEHLQIHKNVKEHYNVINQCESNTCLELSFCNLSVGVQTKAEEKHSNICSMKFNKSEYLNSEIENSLLRELGNVVRYDEYSELIGQSELTENELLNMRELYSNCKSEYEVLANKHRCLHQNLEKLQFLTLEEQQRSVELLFHFEQFERQRVYVLCEDLLESIHISFDSELNSLCIMSEHLSKMEQKCKSLEELNEQIRVTLQSLHEQHVELCEVSTQQLGLIKSLETEIVELRKNIELGKENNDVLLNENMTLTNKLQDVLERETSIKMELSLLKTTYTTKLLESEKEKELHDKQMQSTTESYMKEITKFERMCKANVTECNAAEMKMKECFKQQYNIEVSSLTWEESYCRLCVSNSYYAEVIPICTSFYLKSDLEILKEKERLSLENKHISNNHIKIENELESRLRNYENKCESQNIIIHNLQEELDVCRRENGEWENKLSDEIDKCTSLNINNAWLKEQIESMRQELTELESTFNINLNLSREEHEQRELQNNELQKEIKGMEEKLLMQEENNNKLNEMNWKINEELFSVQTTLTAYEQKMKNAEEEIVKLNNELAAKKAIIKKSTTMCTEWEQHTTSLNNKIRLLEKELETFTNSTGVEIEEYKREIERLQKASTELKALTEKLERKLTVENNKKLDEESNLAHLQKENNNLQQKIIAIEKEKKTLFLTQTKYEEELRNIVYELNVARSEQGKLKTINAQLESELRSKLEEDLEPLITLSEEQEKQLESLRRKNAFWNKVVKMFISSCGLTELPTFNKQINLSEGAIRHPKKRVKEVAIEHMEKKLLYL